MDPNQTQATELLIRRRRSAIMAADVAGYSRLMGSDEDNTLKRLDAARRIMDSRIAQHGGRIANTAGDSVIAEFMAPAAAVRCAVEVQAALRQRNRALLPPDQLQFRIGINYGEVVANRADLLGDNVNVAARIENLAPPGGVLISESMHEQVYGRMDLTFRSLGEQELKNISRRIVVYEVVQDGVAAPATTPPAARTAAAKPASSPRGRGPLLALLGLLVLAALAGIAYLATGGQWPLQQAAVPTPQPPAPGTLTPQPLAPQPSAPALHDVARLTTEAAAALAGFPCARLRATIAADGGIAVAGYVGSAADGDAAVARLAALPGAAAVTRDIAVLPAPLCSLLSLLPADAVLRRDDPAAPRLAVGGNGGVYRVGESLLITATATTAFDGHLYVLYVDAEGQYVAHLLPNDLRADSRVAAGQQVTIGDMPAEIDRYRIEPPLGTNMVLVLSTRGPLYDGARPKLEKTAEFLPELQRMLGALGPRDLRAAWGMVTFVER